MSTSTSIVGECSHTFDDESSHTSTSEITDESTLAAEISNKESCSETSSVTSSNSKSFAKVPILKQKKKRRVRICPISGCHKTFVNVTHHWKKHPEYPRAVFLNDNKAKEERAGEYKKYDGYKCYLCDKVILFLKEHCLKLHKEVNVHSNDFMEKMEQCKIKKTTYQSLLKSYEHSLKTMGVGKRNSVDHVTAVAYRKQVQILAPDVETLASPESVYNNLQDKAVSASTKYTYLATLSNFLEFITMDFIQFSPAAVAKLRKHVARWLQKQRKPKEKQQRFVKEKSRKKLQGLQNPIVAIMKYEEKNKSYMSTIRNKNAPTKKEIELLCGDIFCRIICRLGCRGCIFTGMTIHELENAEKTEKGNFSILIEEQKEQNRHGCIVISKDEYVDLKSTSAQVWNWAQQKPSETSKAFPSLKSTHEWGSRMRPPSFNNIFQRVSGEVFTIPVTATDVRKIITTNMRKQPLPVQIAVARAEGHSMEMAEKVYNFAHPMEMVESALTAMKNAASIDVPDIQEAPEASQSTLKIFSELDSATCSTDSLPIQKSPDETIKFIRVKFSDDNEILDVFRLSDIRTQGLKKIKRFSDIAINGICKARWPGDRLFYNAKRVEPKVSTCSSTKSGYYSDDTAQSPKKKGRKNLK